MGTKSIKIDEAYHRTAQRLADNHKSSIKEFVEATINYFHKTHLDPRDVTASGHSKILSTLSQRMEFLVGFSKKQETDHILPLKEMLAELSQQVATLPQQNGHGHTAKQTEINELLKELYPKGIFCPNCQNPQNFTFQDPDLLCKHPGCGYQLQIIWGEKTMFSELDVLNLLTGGITRLFEEVEIEGNLQSGRFFLDQETAYQLHFLSE